LRDKVMPKGPKGEKRPAGVIGNAVKVMRIATGEEEDTVEPQKTAAKRWKRDQLRLPN
jgi:hypothetical protein